MKSSVLRRNKESRSFSQCGGIRERIDFLKCLRFHCGPVHAKGICGVGVWAGTHSRFHGLSGSNGLSGTEDFRENQRYIETGERRNRCGDGQRRERKKREIGTVARECVVMSFCHRKRCG